MHWLAHHASKSPKDQFKKLCRLTARGISKGQFFFKLDFPNSRWVLTKKTKEHYQKEKKSKNVLNFIPGALVDGARSKICLISIYQALLADCRRQLGRIKLYPKVTFSNLQVSIKNKPKNNITYHTEQTVKMS